MRNQTLRMTTAMRQTASLRARRGERGIALVETMVAMLIVLIVSGGLAALSTVSMQSNRVEVLSTQVASSARDKIEEVQAMAYSQVGIKATGVPGGAGYYVADPNNAPTFDLANGDRLLSDTISVGNGTIVTRTVTVTATDDPADGTGTSDFDALTDPNTGTVLDYKRVTVVATATVDGKRVSQTLSTVIRGTLPDETDGATGKDSDGTAPKKLQKVSKKTAVVSTDVDGDVAPVAKKTKIKK